MKSVSSKELAWVQGSDPIYLKSGRMVRLSVLIHGNETLKVGLLRHLMKVAELSEEDL